MAKSSWTDCSILAPKNDPFPQGSFFEVPWSLRLPFWCILVAFGRHFGIILVILDNFGTHVGQFCTFWHQLCSKIMFFEPLTAAKHHFGTLLVIFYKFSVKITFSTPFSVEHVQNTDDTSAEGTFPFERSLSHLARSGTLP